MNQRIRPVGEVRKGVALNVPPQVRRLVTSGPSSAVERRPGQGGAESKQPTPRASKVAQHTPTRGSAVSFSPVYKEEAHCTEMEGLFVAAETHFKSPAAGNGFPQRAQRRNVELTVDPTWQLSQGTQSQASGTAGLFLGSSTGALKRRSKEPPSEANRFADVRSGGADGLRHSNSREALATLGSPRHMPAGRLTSKDNYQQPSAQALDTLALDGQRTEVASALARVSDKEEAALMQFFGEVEPDTLSRVEEISNMILEIFKGADSDEDLLISLPEVKGIFSKFGEPLLREVEAVLPGPTRDGNKTTIDLYQFLAIFVTLALKVSADNIPMSTIESSLFRNDSRAKFQRARSKLRLLTKR